MSFFTPVILKKFVRRAVKVAHEKYLIWKKGLILHLKHKKFQAFENKKFKRIEIKFLKKNLRIGIKNFKFLFNFKVVKIRIEFGFL